MSLPITERQTSDMTGTDLFYTVVRDSGGEYGDPYYVRLASLAAYLGYAESAGDVKGPASATDNAVAKFNGTTGKNIQNSVVIIGNAGEVSGVKTFALSEYIDFTEMSTPSNPAVNIARMYSKDDGGTTKMYFRDSTGAETELGGGGGAGDVTAAAVLADHTMVRGDGGAKGVQDTGITISDADILVSPGSATFDDLYLYDTNASHTLLFHWNEDEAAANRVLNFIMGGATRTITFSGNPTLGDWFDQSVKQAASPSYAGMAMTGYVDWTEIGAPGNPGANIARMYCRDDGGDTKLYFKDSAGAETELGGVGSATAVTAAAVIVNNALTRGDGGARGIQDCGWIMGDDDVLTAAGDLDMGDKDVINLRDIKAHDGTFNIILPTPGTVNIKGTIPANWYNVLWLYRVAVTSQNAKVAEALARGYVKLDLLPAGFHNHVKAGGVDIRVTKADGTTEVAREVSYDAGTDKGELYFDTAGMQTGSDVLWYIYYGNAAANDYAINAEFGAESVPRNSASMVQHMNEDPSGGAPQLIDSTDNDNDGTSIGAMLTEDLVDAKVGKGWDLDGDNDGAGCGNDASLITGGDRTFECLVKGIQTTYAASEYFISDYRCGLLWLVAGDDELRFQAYDGNWDAVSDALAGYNPANWYHIVGVVTSGSQVELIVNGVSKGTTAHGTTQNSTLNFDIGHINGAQFADLITDEVCVYNTAHSVNWALTRSNNLLDVATFWSIGVEEGLSFSPANLDVQDNLDVGGDAVIVGTLTADDLLLYDTNASHTLIFHWNEDEAGANRTLNWVVGGADRTITLSGNPTLGDWFDQAVKQASNVTFGTIGCTELTATGSIMATGGGETGRFLTGGAGNTVFAFSGDNFDIRAGNGGASAQNVLRVTSAGHFDFYDGNITTIGTLGCGVFTVTLPNAPTFTVTELDLTGSAIGDAGYTSLLTGTPTMLPSGLGIRDAIVVFGNTLGNKDPRITFTTDTLDLSKSLYYDLTADTFILEDDLNIEGTLGCGAITSTSTITAQGGQVYVGVDNTTRGVVTCYGSLLGAVGGTLTLFVGDAYQGPVSKYSIYVYQDDLYIGPNTNEDFMKIVAGTSLEIDGNVGIGTAPEALFQLLVTHDTGYAIKGITTKSDGTAIGVYGQAITDNTGTNYGIYGYATNAGAGVAYAGYFAGRVHATGCVTDGTCELLDNVDALAVIKDIYEQRSGETNEFGHEKYDMKKIHAKYPFLVAEIRDIDPETGEDKGLIYGDRLGAKSDLLYRATMQHDEKIEALETEVDRLRELVKAN